MGAKMKVVIIQVPGAPPQARVCEEVELSLEGGGWIVGKTFPFEAYTISVNFNIHTVQGIYEVEVVERELD